MRRKDREMGVDFAEKLIDNSAYAVLSLIDADGFPYGIPLSIVRKNNMLYFHSAKSGKKTDGLREGVQVAVTFVGEVKVPELYSKKELENLLADEKRGAMLISKVFTTEYESAMVFGKIYPVNDVEESTEALRMICEKYTPSKMDYFNLAIRSGLPRTNVYRIDIDKITAKRKRFDPSGEEMKYGKIH